MSRGKGYSNISATQDAITLKNGLFGVIVTGTFGGGTVKLQKLSRDGSTYVDVLSFSASGYDTASLSEGTYRIAIATASAVYVDISPVQTGDKN